MVIIPDTPILVHFKRLALPVPNHFNQSMVLSSSRRLNVFTLKSSLSILCQYHDMLRAVWDNGQLTVRDITTDAPFCLEEYNLRNSSDVAADMLPLCERLQASLDIEKGPMMRVAVFHLPDKDAVLTVIHHLVVDGVSWRVIAEDLNKIYSTLIKGKMSVALPKRKCGFEQYSQALNEYANCPELLAEEAYWQTVVDKINRQRTVFRPMASTVHHTSFRLDAMNSARLVSDGYKRFNAGINALLLTALSRAWKDATGQTFLSVALEGHGREPFGRQPLSLERVVGWFTSICPLALTCEDTDLMSQIDSINAMLESIPNNGLGYGVLADITSRENLRCEPLMTFNYLGALDESIPGGIFSFDSTLPQGSCVNSSNVTGTELSIDCCISDGRLSGILSYDNSVIDENQAQKLCEAFVFNMKLFNEKE